MLTKNQKITIAMLKNRGFDVDQIIQHFINTSQERLPGTSQFTG